MKNLSEFTDREIALMMGALHSGGNRAEALIVEAAYRLVRAHGGKMSKDEEQLVEEIHSYDFRMREAQRISRRLQRKPSTPAKAKARVIEMNKANAL